METFLYVVNILEFHWMQKRRVISTIVVLGCTSICTAVISFLHGEIACGRYPFHE